MIFKTFSKILLPSIIISGSMNTYNNIHNNSKNIDT